MEEGEDGGEGGGKEAVMELEDATELAVFSPYQWREWSIVRSQDCLYLWNEFSSLELSNVSNGWFRFLIDNKLATMYSSGSTEGGPDSFGEGYSRLHCAYMGRKVNAIYNDGGSKQECGHVHVRVLVHVYCHCALCTLYMHVYTCNWMSRSESA